MHVMVEYQQQKAVQKVNVENNEVVDDEEQTNFVDSESSDISTSQITNNEVPGKNTEHQTPTATTNSNNVGIDSNNQ